MGEPTLDPREILKAAGVKCPELDALMTCDDDHPGSCGDCLLRKQGADALWCRESAMCALARLVAGQQGTIMRLRKVEHFARMAIDDDIDDSAKGWMGLREMLEDVGEWEARHA